MKRTKRTGKVISLLLVIMMLFSVVSTGMFSVSAAETEAVDVAAESETKTYYFSPNGNWTNLFCVYAWEDGAKDKGTWAQLNKTDVDDVYSVTLSADYTHVIFASRMIPAFDWSAVDNKTDELEIPEGCNYLTLTGSTSAMWGYYLADDLSGGAVETKKVFFSPNADWTDIQYYLYHDFVVYAYNEDDTEGTWAEFELVEGEFGVYPTVWMAEIPVDCDNVIFCRVEKSNVENGWYVWEQTDDQTIPADSNRFFQNIDAQTGVWSYYELPETDLTEPETSEPEATEPGADGPDTPVKTKTIYFTANEDWLTYTSDMASISAYTWTTDVNDGTWVWAEALENGNGIYAAEVPEDDIHICFGLCFGASPDVIFAQTDDQLIPDDSNHFTQDEAGNSGLWSFYAAGGTVPAGRYYSVVFVNDDNTLLKAQVVAEGGSAVAPADPAKASDAQYTYVFAGWNVSFTNVKSDIIVRAVYTAVVNEYTVTFTGKDDCVIFAQTVPYGGTVEAPEAPVVDGYTFAGWNGDFSKITENTTIKAVYNKNASGSGKLRIEVSGGNGFTISVNGGGARPQGASYFNTKMTTGAEVTVVANKVAGLTFLGWMNESGAVVSETDTYTFVTTGNDYFKAVYQTVVEDVNVVIFKNSRAAGGKGQILDMQYYSAKDEVEFPDTPTLAGYTFTGWNMTPQDIKASLAAGQDVIVTANWERAKVYIDITVSGGTISTAAQPNGKYLAYGSVTVVADAAPAGQKFAYWTDATGKIMSYNTAYKFYPAADTVLEAVFVASGATVEKQPLVFIAGDPTTDGEKITYTISWDVDASFGKVTNYGIVVVDENDYNADTFYHGSGDSKLFDRAASVKTQSDTKTLGLGSRYYDHSYYAKAFMIYTDASTGKSVTIYSDMILTYKPAP